MSSTSASSQASIQSSLYISETDIIRASVDILTKEMYNNFEVEGFPGYLLRKSLFEAKEKQIRMFKAKLQCLEWSLYQMYTAYDKLDFSLEPSFSGDTTKLETNERVLKWISTVPELERIP